MNKEEQAKPKLSKKEQIELKKKESKLIKEDLLLQKKLIKERKELNKLKKKLAVKNSPGLFKAAGILYLTTPFILGFGYIFYGNSNAVASLTYGVIGTMTLATALLLIILYLAKKTHALVELKANISGNPISLFFSDNKRLEWKVIKPENEMIQDKKLGTFLLNKNGSYLDFKTKNIFMAFNTPLGTNASIENYGLAHGIANVYRDENVMNNIRKIIQLGEVEGDNIKVTNQQGEQINMKPFKKLRESIDFSHLKSLLNTITPHNMSASIEMKVAQRVGTMGMFDNKVFIATLIAVLVGGGLLYLVITAAGGSAGTAAPAVQAAATSIGG